jgi:peptidoglycan/xylan/chitin deacetylase (PgdA/CDA1 family)
MIPILMYHQVAEIPRSLDPMGLAVSPAQFERQMSFLAHKGYQCLSLGEAVEHIRARRDAPASSFVLTFDDGYQNILFNACPILEKFGFTATIFLVAGQMGSLSSWRGQDGDLSGQLLSWDEAGELARRGFTLGSHTLSHDFLNRLDDASAFEEIRKSKMLLQERLQISVDFLSYPFSRTDARVERLVEVAGYTAACAGDSGPRGLFHLWRVPCGRNDTILSFSLKARGWYNKRTALRESGAGLFLRRCIRMIRRRLPGYYPSKTALSSNNPGRDVERDK